MTPRPNLPIHRRAVLNPTFVDSNIRAACCGEDFLCCRKLDAAFGRDDFKDFLGNHVQSVGLGLDFYLAFGGEPLLPNGLGE